MIFRHVVTLYPVTITQSTIGGIGQTIGTGTNYTAFVQIRSESIDLINQTGTARTAATIYIQGNCPAKPLDRITYDGKTYEVVGAMPQRSPTTIDHTKIMAIELDQTSL
jgi:hypothetical protein